ncbi:MAG: hypothetical protein KIT68_03665 [Phycisphaeraceae bacterium]|nr:hypothetical protein [Phycisphaeraceae bacterium]
MNRRDVPARRRGFALPLVALLGLLAGIAVTLLLENQSYGRLAAKRMEQQYQTHHLQAGMKEMIEFWLMIFKRPNNEPLSNDTVIGFDLLTRDNKRLEIRLADAQGSVLRSPPGSDLSYMDIAADILETWGESGPGTVRTRGPSRVSLHSAPPQVLQALALAIDPKCRAAAFAEAVVAKREIMRLNEADMAEVLSASGMNDDDRTVLKMSCTIDPGLWMVVVTVRSASGTILDRQGGLAVGSLKTGFGGAGGWTFLSWGPLSTAEEASTDAGAARRR